MRLLARRGKERVKGDEDVELRVQNRKTAAMATAKAVQLKVAVMAGRGLRGSDVRQWRGQLSANINFRFVVMYPVVFGGLD